MEKRPATGVGLLSLAYRAGGLLAVAMTATGATGCVERDPFSASDVAAADAFHASEAAAARERSAPRDPAGGKVTCTCDAEGGLHVQAPHRAVVRAVETSIDAEAEITMPERPPGTRIRQTVSLGFVGDGKLTAIPSRGGPWNVPDALLPPHQHRVPDRPVGYVRYGYGGAPGYASRSYTHQGFGGRASSAGSRGRVGVRGGGRRAGSPGGARAPR